MIIADTSGLLASFDDQEPQHERVHRCLDESSEAMVVLASRYHTGRILTLDRRRFHALRPLDGEPFGLLP